MVRAALSIALSLLASNANAGEISGTVSSVQDGDTLTFSHPAATYRVRLVDIDAPEANQSFGAQSTASLRELCQSKPATLDGKGTDRYGRLLARVTCAGVDANAEQVRRGFAWVFDRYAPKDSPLYRFQSEAQNARRGLWVDPAPVAPWDWRQSGRLAK